jgi:uncharacterized protein
VLVYALREDASDHLRYRAWLIAALASSEPFGFSELVLSGVVRVATHPRIFTPPTPLDRVMTYVDALREQPNAVSVTPGERHWAIFQRLCVAASAKGNLVADAYLAALAIESGSEWITTDRDFSRFPGLRWRHPLAA